MGWNDMVEAAAWSDLKNQYEDALDDDASDKELAAILRRKMLEVEGI